MIAAYELLQEDGLEGLTIRAVLKRTGLARRAFYESFAGKDDLVLAVFEQTLRTLAEHLANVTSALNDPLEAVKTFVFDIVMGELKLGTEAGDRRSAAFSREHLRLAESRPADLQAALRPMMGLLTDLVDTGIRLGQFRQCDPSMQATLIYNLVSTTTHTELLAEEGGKPNADRRQKLAEETWEFCRRAIMA